MSEMPDIRLIVLDVDGTLVDDEKDVPPPNLRALRAARERGIQVAIASGRMVPSIEIMEERLGFDCALIAYNGGKVVGPRAGGREVISHRPVPTEISDPLIDFALETGTVLNLYHEDTLFCDRSHEGCALARLYTRRTGSVFTFTDIRAFRGVAPTKLLILAEPAERERLHDEFSRSLRGRANVLRTEPEYLEFMAEGVDKSTALPDLAGHIGCSVRQILAVGDAENDRDMLLAAGVGVAVANARPSVLEAAPYRTERTNNEGAVAEALERWVLGALPGLWS